MKSEMLKYTRVAMIAWVMCLSFGASLATAAPLTIPNTFTAGAPISSAAVNTNFAAIVAAVNANKVRLAALEAVTSTTISPATIAGTWAIIFDSFDVGVPGQNNVNVSRETDRGTLVINVNGTATVSITGGWDINAGLQNIDRCINSAGQTVACGSPTQVGTASEQKVGFADMATTGPPSSVTYTLIGNKITLTDPTGATFTGHVSKNGQMMILEGNSPATHLNTVVTLIKIQ